MFNRLRSSCNLRLRAFQKFPIALIYYSLYHSFIISRYRSQILSIFYWLFIRNFTRSLLSKECFGDYLHVIVFLLICSINTILIVSTIIKLTNNGTIYFSFSLPLAILWLYPIIGFHFRCKVYLIATWRIITGQPNCHLWTIRFPFKCRRATNILSDHDNTSLNLL